jgi:hypothetical protein
VETVPPASIVHGSGPGASDALQRP